MGRDGENANEMLSRWNQYVGRGREGEGGWDEERIGNEIKGRVSERNGR